MPIHRFINIRRWTHRETENADKATQANNTSASLAEAEAAKRKEKLELAKARRVAEQEAKISRLASKKAKAEKDKARRAMERMDNEIWKDEITRQVISMCRGSKSDILSKISRECGVRPSKAFRRISRSGLLERFLGLETHQGEARGNADTEEQHAYDRTPITKAQHLDECAELAELVTSKRAMKAKELLKALRETGFITIRDGEGSHVIAKNERNGRISVISVHNPGSELNHNIIRETVLQLGINISNGTAGLNAAE